MLGGVILQYVWRIQEIFPQLASIGFTALVSVSAVALFVLDHHPARRLQHARHRIYQPVLAIFILAVLSVPTSLHDGASVEFLTGNFMKTVVLAGVLAASIRDRRDVERLLYVFVLGGAGYVLSAIAFASPGSGRLGGKGSYDPNDLGLFTVSTLPFCIYLMRRSAGSRDRILGAIAMVALMIGTVQSGSRGGFLALVAVVAYGLLALDAVRSSKRVTITVIAVVVMLGAAGDSYWERMRTILSPQEDYNWSGQAEAGRVEVWKRGIGYMIRRPVFGVGVDQFNVAEGTWAPQASRQQRGIGWRWSAAHSSYVQIGAELGVFGLTAFFVLLGVAYFEGRRIGREATNRDDRLLGQAFAGMIVAYAVGGAFLSQAYSTYLYFAIGLLLGFSRVVMLREPAARRSAPVAISPAGSQQRHRVAAWRAMPDRGR